jgi:hypothetical protein
MACRFPYILLKYKPKLQALAVEAVKEQNGFVLRKMVQKLPEIRPG